MVGNRLKKGKKKLQHHREIWKRLYLREVYLYKDGAHFRRCRPRFYLLGYKDCNLDSLVFDLVVKMSSEPVIEPRLLHIACSSQLHGDPVLSPVHVNLHGQVADLGHPREPVALQEPDEEVPAKAGPESSQHGRKCHMEKQVEYSHHGKLLKLQRTSDPSTKDSQLSTKDIFAVPCKSKLLRGTCQLSLEVHFIHTYLP